MDLILSILKEISSKKKIKIYIIGQYIYNKLLGNSNNNIEIAIVDNMQDVIDSLLAMEDKEHSIMKEENNLFKVIHENELIYLKIDDIKNSSIEGELKSRSFTIDSIAIDIMDYDNITEDRLIDPFNSYKDIKEKIIRHNHSNTFKEPENIIKAVALMAELDFSLSDKTKELIIESKKHFDIISGEEVTKQLFKILSSRKSNYYFSYMEKELDVLESVFPEIKEMRYVGECKYHVVDVLTHSFLTLEKIEDIIYSDEYFEDHIRDILEKHSNEKIALDHKRLEIIKLGAFFHDVGKPSAKKIDETGRTRFRGHEITGAEIIKNISERLGLSIKERDILYRLVSKHMIPLVLYKKNDVSGKALYKMFNELKEEVLDVSLIALADIIATRMLLDPSENMGKYKIHIEYIVNNYVTRFKEIEDISKIITGRVIMSGFDLDEEVMIEDLIEEVRKAIYNGKISANQEAAIDYIEKIL